MTVVRGWRGDAAAGKPDGRERDHAALLPARMREAMKTEVSARTHVDVRPQAEFMERLWRNLAGLVKIPSHAGNPAGLHAARIHANGEKGRRRPPDVRPRRRRRQIRGVHAPGHAAVVRGLRGGQGRPPLHRRSDRGGRHRERPARAGAGRVHGPRLAHAGRGGAIPLASAFWVANPKADILLWGCEEPTCAIHAPNESVSFAELRSMTTAEALLLKKTGTNARGGDPR